jgi:hypothetical protein
MAETTTSSSNPSNKDRAAHVLNTRLFKFDRIKTKNRLNEPVAKTFEDVWNTFVCRIIKILALKPHECRYYDHGRALQRFLVAMRGNYTEEDQFMRALMDALQETLAEVGMETTLRAKI